MAQTLSPKEMEAFSVKLQDWSATLSDKERTFVKQMLEQRRNYLVSRRTLLTDDDLESIVGGAIHPVNLSSVLAPKLLDAKFILNACW